MAAGYGWPLSMPTATACSASERLASERGARSWRIVSPMKKRMGRCQMDESSIIYAARRLAFVSPIWSQCRISSTCGEGSQELSTEQGNAPRRIAQRDILTRAQIYTSIITAFVIAKHAKTISRGGRNMQPNGSSASAFDRKYDGHR